MSEYAGNLQFPWKLHGVLEQEERNGNSHIVSWLPNGDAFMVKDKAEFANEIMPGYFNSNKFKTFQRNLNLWGFRTLTKNPNKGAIFHPDFLRNKPGQCRMMKRIRIRKKLPRMTLEEFHTSVQDTQKTSNHPQRWENNMVLYDLFDSMGCKSVTTESMACFRSFAWIL